MDVEPKVDIPRVDAVETKYKGRFIMYNALDWTDAEGVRRHWEAADRVADKGAVLILARLVQSDRMVLIRQFRPPARRAVFEFPAGLIDADESPEQAAARELREETGYMASGLTVFPAAYTTPGLSSESVCMVVAEIDETLPENLNPQTHFDASESIETLLLPRSDLLAFYRRETEKGNAFDAKLATYILAISAVSPLSSPSVSL